MYNDDGNSKVRVLVPKKIIFNILRSLGFSERFQMLTVICKELINYFPRTY